MSTIGTMSVLPNEGKVVHIERTYHRRECDECAEPAHFKVTFLLDNARRNPASSAYGRDDCSWCEDDVAYACHEHKDRVRLEPRDGYIRNSVFPATECFAHLFLTTTDKETHA